MSDQRVTAHSSIKNTTINNGGPAPLQGYDVGMWVYDIGRKRTVLAGQFTSTLITIHIGTEPYMPAGNRQALLLDGEIQTNIEMEKGQLSADIMQETFGFKQFDHKHRYIRSPRFNITFALDPVDWTAMDEPGMHFETFIKRYPAGYMVLTEVKMDTLMIAATAGKSVVANKWRGQSQGVLAEVNTLADYRMKFPTNADREFDANGQPVDIDKVRTLGIVNRQTPEHHFTGYADQASTYSPIFEPSRQGDDLFSILSSAVTFSQLIAERQRLMLVSYLPGVKEAIQKINDAIQTIFGGDRNVMPSIAVPPQFDGTNDFEGPLSSSDGAPQSDAEKYILGEMLRAQSIIHAPGTSPAVVKAQQKHYNTLLKALAMVAHGQFEVSYATGIITGKIDNESISVPISPRGEQIIKSVRGALPGASNSPDRGPSQAVDQDFGKKDVVRSRSRAGTPPLMSVEPSWSTATGQSFNQLDSSQPSTRGSGPAAVPPESTSR